MAHQESSHPLNRLYQDRASAHCRASHFPAHQRPDPEQNLGWKLWCTLHPSKANDRQRVEQPELEIPYQRGEHRHQVSTYAKKSYERRASQIPRQFPENRYQYHASLRHFNPTQQTSQRQQPNERDQNMIPPRTKTALFTGMLVRLGGKRVQNPMSITTFTTVVTHKPSSTIGTRAEKPKHG